MKHDFDCLIFKCDIHHYKKREEAVGGYYIKQVKPLMGRGLY
jgi:hypothetical protein